MTVPQKAHSMCTIPGEYAQSLPFVILSDRRESKDLRTDLGAELPEVRRSFDFGLRPPLRMT